MLPIISVYIISVYVFLHLGLVFFAVGCNAQDMILLMTSTTLHIDQAMSLAQSAVLSLLYVAAVHGHG